MFAKLEQTKYSSHAAIDARAGQAGATTVTSPTNQQMTQYHAVMAQYSAGPLSMIQSPTGDFMK